MKSIQLLFLLISIHLMGQKTIETTEKQTDNKSYIPYFLKCYEADSLYFAKNYEKSFQTLDVLFKEYEPKNSYMIYEYETYVKSSCQIGNFEKIDEKISKMIGDFGYEKEFFLADSTDVLFKGFQKANINENDYGLLRFNYLSKIDKEMRKELYLMDYYARSFGKNNFFSLTTDKEKLEIIENYKNEILDWFDNGIFPNENLIGNKNFDENKSHGLTDIIIQFDNETFDKIVEPKLKFFLEKGELTPHEFAEIIDFREVIENHDSKYLEFFLVYNFEDNADYSKYNLERKKIGMPSVEYSLWKLDLMVKE